MTVAALIPIAALAWLQVKHLICDYFLQTNYQLANKGIYGHPGGIMHAGIHIVGTIPVFLIMPVSVVAALAILVVEFLVHYHIDWLKVAIGRHTGWTTRDAPYWWAMGTDQFAHQLTYLAIVAALIVGHQ